MARLGQHHALNALLAMDLCENLEPVNAEPEPLGTVVAVSGRMSLIQRQPSGEANLAALCPSRPHTS
jgi:hypothetical protein